MLTSRQVRILISSIDLLAFVVLRFSTDDGGFSAMDSKGVGSRHRPERSAGGFPLSPGLRLFSMPKDIPATLTVASWGQCLEERSGLKLQQATADHMAVNAGTNHNDA